MPRSWLERRRIDRQARAKLGLKQSPEDHFSFMQQCVEAMTVDGTAGDENEAELICQLLWEEQSEWDDFGD